jgi:hypothetical protein
MAEVFGYVNREQLRHSGIQYHAQASRKRRNAEDDRSEHHRLRVISIDTGAPSHNPGFVTVAERGTPGTDIAPVSDKAGTTE